MSQSPPNPYAQRPTGYDFEPPVDSRTSVLAVIALVLALLCFIPGLGVLALLVGGVAVLLISGSGGRLRGMGIAATACVIGLITSVLWVLITVGMVGAAQQATKGLQPMLIPAQTALAAMEKGDFTAARATFSPALDAKVTDEEMQAFVNAYQAKLGSFQSGPQTLKEYLGAWFSLGAQMGNSNVGPNAQNVLPIPARFSSDWAIIYFPLIPGTKPPPAPAGSGLPYGNFPVENLGIWTTDGTTIWLVAPPAQLQPPTPSGVDAMEDFTRPEGDDARDADAPASEPREPTPAEPSPNPSGPP